ncbi:MAG: hypothetical protein AB7O46_00190 [Xanthobacteraceae bacterium]
MSITAEKTLMEKMRRLADAGHARADELRDKAEKLDAAIKNYDAMKVLGAWARARRLWCDCTGEDLV